MKGHFCCFIIQTRAQGGSISVLHFGTPPLITSMLHAGAQRSTSGDSLTVSRSVTSVRNIVPVTSSFGDAYFSTYMEVRWTRRSYVCCTTLSCVCHTCYTVSQTLSLQLNCRMVRLSVRVVGRMKKGGDHGLQGVYIPSVPMTCSFSCVSYVKMYSHETRMHVPIMGSSQPEGGCRRENKNVNL